MNNLQLRRNDGTQVQAKLKKLRKEYINYIINLQNEIYNGLEDKQLYAPTTKDEFLSYIDKGATILGCITEEDELIALGVYIKKGYDSGNYGYDLDIKGEELLKVGQIESTIVKEEYRGNGLQRIICESLEEIAKKENTSVMTATASPLNKVSVNTFLKLDYKIMMEKEKYGGLKRYVFMKNLK